MKVRWIRICQWLLGFLGIGASVASCHNAVMTEYGCPSMDYSVKGKVVDSQTGEGVAGIEVSHIRYGTQVDTTNVDGSFEISGNIFPESEFSVDFRDIDPDNNGSYESGSQTIPLVKVKEGKGAWYEGAFEAVDVVVKVEKKAQ